MTGLTQAPKNYHLYTCQGIKDAFYFDREEVRNKSIISLLKRCLGDFRYRALVTLRLCQYFFKKKQEIITSCANCTNSEVDAFSSSSIVVLSLLRSRPLAALLYCLYRSLTEVTRKSLYITHGINISPGTLIGKNFWGIFRNLAISAETRIEENAHIEGNVTVAATKNGVPIIERDVVIHTGAVIMGPVRIGEGSVVGANSLVIKSVNPYTTVVGVPAKTIFKRTQKE